MSVRLLLGLTLLLPVAPKVLEAQELEFRPSEDSVVIGARITLHSATLGEDRPIQVYLPAGYAGSNRIYPVLYLVDGESLFHQVTGVVDAMAWSGIGPPMLVVGIPNTHRNRDLTPTPMPATAGSGGADAFLDFIEHELVPFIEREYRTAPYRLLGGHSFGGLFVVHALQDRPRLFRAGLAISPALWWDGDLMLKRLDRLARSGSGSRHLFLSLGDEAALMSGSYEPFVAELASRAFPGLEVQSRRFPDDDHLSTTLPAFHAGLRTVFPDWKMPRTLPDSGPTAVRAFYIGLTERYGYEISPPPALIARLDAQPTEITLSREQLQRYVGDYSLSPDLIIAVGLDERSLYISRRGSSDKQRIFPSSKTTFFFREFDGQLTFHLDAAGVPTHYFINQGGEPLRADRIR